MLTKTTRVLLAATCAGGVLGPLTATTASADVQRGFTCDKDPGPDPGWYEGPSASKRYDAAFHRSVTGIPHLDDGYTPQGLDVWTDFSGARDLILVSSYKGDGESYLTGMDRLTGQRVGTIKIAQTHASGVAITKNWVFVSERGYMRKYRAPEIAKALKADGIPTVPKTGATHRFKDKDGGSFLDVEGDYLWSGVHDKNSRNTMHRYRIGKDGSLSDRTGPWEIPKKAQGLIVTDSHFIYSSSRGESNRSNIYVVRRGERDMDKTRVKCFRAPTMSEEIAQTADGKAYLVFESGATQYGDAKNPIESLHAAPVPVLEALA